MDLYTRLAHPNDLPEILSVQTRLLRELSTDTYNSAQIEALVQSQGAARQQTFSDEVVYVACIPVQADSSFANAESDADPIFQPEKIIAVATLITHRAQIGGLYVHPDYARQGVASQLLTAVENVATQQDMRVLRVLSSLVAAPFYRAMGYSYLFSVTSSFHGEVIGCIEMAKALDGGALPRRLTQQDDVWSDVWSATWLIVLACLVVLAVFIALH